MSYCRWSSNNFDCDLYCYESDCGYETHVAGLRVVGKVPPFPDSINDGKKEWMRKYEAHRTFMDTCKREKIGLPCDGKRFCDPDLKSFLKRVTDLKEMGYHVPRHVFTAIEREIKELTNPTKAD